MHDPWPVHTLVFDLDDTLYPERDYVMGGFHAVGDWLKARQGVEAFEGRAEELFNAGHRGRIFDEALKRLGVAPTPELIDQLVGVYRGHEPRLRLFPEAEEMLDWGGRNFRMALISDGYLGVQEGKARALALDRWISVRVFTDAMGRDHWKPSPWAFQEVMRRLPGEPSGFVYVGDNPRKDFVGARAVGWRTVRVRRPGCEHSGAEAPAELAPDLEISSLLELKALLAPAGESPEGVR